MEEIAPQYFIITIMQSCLTCCLAPNYPDCQCKQNNDLLFLCRHIFIIPAKNNVSCGGTKNQEIGQPAIYQRMALEEQCTDFGNASKFFPPQLNQL